MNDTFAGVNHGTLESAANNLLGTTQERHKQFPQMQFRLQMRAYMERTCSQKMDLRGKIYAKSGKHKTKT